VEERVGEGSNGRAFCGGAATHAPTWIEAPSDAGRVLAAYDGMILTP
jgi:hypothetical protein